MSEPKAYSTERAVEVAGALLKWTPLCGEHHEYQCTDCRLRLPADWSGIAATLREYAHLKRREIVLEGAMRAAYACMNYLGDVLNNNDMTMPEDEEYTNPLFERVRAGWVRIGVAADKAASVVLPPLPMLLNYPSCHGQHVDREEWATPEKAHKTHKCSQCGHEWRPANVATVGVEVLP